MVLPADLISYHEMIKYRAWMLGASVIKQKAKCYQQKAKYRQMTKHRRSDTLHLCGSARLTGGVIRDRVDCGDSEDHARTSFR